jgi:glycerol-3-phosphate acyltransferase PlsY
MREALVLLLAYLLGSIPTGLWLARLAGVDVRTAGSGNIGATNVGRTAGIRLGVLTLVIDLAKGAVPVLAAEAVADSDLLAALSGLAAFYGHIFSLFAGFRGGKGVATAAGVFLALAPVVMGAAFVAFAVVAALSRIVSVASIAAAATLPIVAVITERPLPITAAASLAAATIVATHRENIARLLRGEESRFEPKRRKAKVPR